VWVPVVDPFLVLTGGVLVVFAVFVFFSEGFYPLDGRFFFVALYDFWTVYSSPGDNSASCPALCGLGAFFSATSATRPQSEHL